MHVTAVDDRPELLDGFSGAHQRIGDRAPAEFIRQREWRGNDALVIVSRNFEIDRDALAAALMQPAIGYIGMIGSLRKVRRVFDELTQRGCDEAALGRVHAPIGLDIGADSPAEIAVSVVAELLQVLRGRTGGHMRACSPAKGGDSTLP
jgi:xanthine dehydrogenase accessory factor